MINSLTLIHLIDTDSQTLLLRNKECKSLSLAQGYGSSKQLGPYITSNVLEKLTNKDKLNADNETIFKIYS